MDFNSCLKVREFHNHWRKHDFWSVVMIKNNASRDVRENKTFRKTTRTLPRCEHYHYTVIRESQVARTAWQVDRRESNPKSQCRDASVQYKNMRLFQTTPWWFIELGYCCFFRVYQARGKHIYLYMRFYSFPLFFHRMHRSSTVKSCSHLTWLIVL